MAIGALVQRMLALDAAGVERLNAVARGSPAAQTLTRRAASGLSKVEILLMGGLALGGRRSSALRMLAAVAVVYAMSEAMGELWPRPRPFAQLALVEAVVSHAHGRSFPSRHVASGLAMAVIGARAHPRLGVAMTIVAAMLGLSRVAAGLHYPSDVLAGAIVGLVVGRLARGG